MVEYYLMLPSKLIKYIKTIIMSKMKRLKFHEYLIKIEKHLPFSTLYQVFDALGTFSPHALKSPDGRNFNDRSSVITAW